MSRRCLLAVQTVDRLPSIIGAMTTSSSIALQLARQSVVAMECTIPAEMTVEEWRRRRSARTRPARRRSLRLFAAAR
jgi:hypothetical protein